MSLKKTCFIVGPIDRQGSEVRRRVDQWMQFIYKPVLSKNYEIIRADRIAEPGLISTQILDHLVSADLVIIDFTDLNPNVMYEAAVRHLSLKPYIQIAPLGGNLPFDIKDFRSIIYDYSELDYPKKMVKLLKEALKVIESPNYKVPQILKTKFDFEQICRDPEEFIKLLSKHLKINEMKRDGEESESRYISPVYDYDLTNVYSVGEAYPYKMNNLSGSVYCPYCGHENEQSRFYKRTLTTYIAKTNYICTKCFQNFSC